MKKEVVVTKSIEMNLIEGGRKGVTNKQMLNVFKTKPTEEVLRQLLSDYPDVFRNSVKYTPDSQKVELESFVQQNGYPEFTVKTGKKIRMPKPVEEAINKAEEKMEKAGVTQPQPVAETQEEAQPTEEVKAEEQQTEEIQEQPQEEIKEQESEAAEVAKPVEEAKPVVLVLESYKNQNNEKMAAVAQKIELLSDDEKEIVKAMVEKDLGPTELAKTFGLTKDQAYSRIFRSKNSIYNRLKQAN